MDIRQATCRDRVELVYDALPVSDRMSEVMLTDEMCPVVRGLNRLARER